MEQWQSFINSEYADEIMIGVGVVLVLFSVMKIVSSSLKMLFWVVLAGLGSASLSYGFQHSPLDLPALNAGRLSDLTDLAAGADSEVLKFLCQKLNAVTGN